MVRWRNWHGAARSLLVLILLLLQPPSAAAAERLIETPARHAILTDFETGLTLFAKDEDIPMPPSSMTKLMTVYLLFEKLKDESLSLDDIFTVSEKAWRMGGSKMFVEINSEVRVEDLLRGIIVQSGNDACIVVAEGIAGTEEAFAELMNQKALDLGMRESHFVNASGWPHPDHMTSARDLAVLARRLIMEFPVLYAYFKETSFTFNKIRQGNRNPLLYKNVGADGLKTGHTQAAGYGLVASATRQEQRLILVVNGLESVNQRSRESERLLNWGFREFGRYALFDPGQPVEEAEVWLGDAGTVSLVLEEPLMVIMPRGARKKMKVVVSYDGPVPAPIAKGQPIARLRVEAPGVPTLERDLLAAVDVGQLGLVGRLGAVLEHLLLGSAAQ